MSVYNNNVRRREDTGHILWRGEWIFGCKEVGHTAILATMVNEEEDWLMLECGHENCGNVLYYNGA